MSDLQGRLGTMRDASLRDAPRRDATSEGAPLGDAPSEDTLAEVTDEHLGDEIVSAIYRQAESISANVVRRRGYTEDWDDRIDSILTSRVLGYPLMLLLLAAVFWITVTGANYPSSLLSELLFRFEGVLTRALGWLNAPQWLHGMAVQGVYRTTAWVVSVMLPPMAIFFPIFTFLEDLGYLPRVAFNLDHWFRRSGAHGKQALTMSMGFGCNAVGVMAARIIESPRERLIAILTNSFVPCNGRFPALIALATVFMSAMSGSLGRFLASATVVLMVLVGIGVTLLISWILSHTLLKGVQSTFTLELPPYRKPQLGRIVVRSLLDRTLFVLRRAVIVAAPAGAVTWLMANTHVHGSTLIEIVSAWLNPMGRSIGLDGAILLAFVLALPANEIVLPIVLMSYLSTGALTEFQSLSAMRELLVAQGWTLVTALNFMLFSLLHFPCGTTLLTIRSETGSTKWAVAAAAITTATALTVCWLVAQVGRIVSAVL
jgi:ferrous iron transport protein B